VNVLRVVNWGTETNGDGDVFVRVTDDEGRDRRLHMTRDAALDLILALHRGVSALPVATSIPGEERAVIQIVRCVEAVTIGPRIGLLLQTADGLELPLLFDQNAVETLTSCIKSPGDIPLPGPTPH